MTRTVSGHRIAPTLRSLPLIQSFPKDAIVTNVIGRKGEAQDAMTRGNGTGADGIGPAITAIEVFGQPDVAVPRFHTIDRIGIDWKSGSESRWPPSSAPVWIAVQDLGVRDQGSTGMEKSLDCFAAETWMCDDDRKRSSTMHFAGIFERERARNRM
jgi:hypothetical protein